MSNLRPGKIKVVISNEKDILHKYYIIYTQILAEESGMQPNEIRKNYQCHLEDLDICDSLYVKAVEDIDHLMDYLFYIDLSKYLTNNEIVLDPIEFDNGDYEEDIIFVKSVLDRIKPYVSELYEISKYYDDCENFVIIDSIYEAARHYVYVKWGNKDEEPRLKYHMADFVRDVCREKYELTLEEYQIFFKILRSMTNAYYD